MRLPRWRRFFWARRIRCRIPAEAGVIPTQPNVISAQTNVIPAKANVIPAQPNVISAQANVIPAQAGIHPVQRLVSLRQSVLREMHMVARTSVVLCSLVAISSLSSADSMRCGPSIVNESVTVAELLQKCGEPASKDIKHEDVFARNSNGSSRKIGTQTTERWRYQRSSRSLPMEVVIVDGKIRSLERAD